MTRDTRIALVAGLLAVVVALAGCGRPATRLPGDTRAVGEPGAAAPATTPADPADEPEAAEPASVVSSVAPAGMPAGFPLPAGDVVLSETVDAEEGVSFTVAIDTAAAPGDAAEAYAAALAGAGYGVEPVTVDEAGATFAFTRGGQAEQGAATFEAQAAGTRASVTLTVME
ncbi:MAG: hypothetical protein FDZ70_08715 [Actinobacteria bacterium]|nr:MAG: hypothetical protein FDZ70_08715 [Actinomycetota bacterium]